MIWIWAGILLRCINIIGDVVVFRMILGFSFRERKFLVAGVVWGIFAVVFPELPLDFNLPLSIFDSYPELSTVIR